VPLTKANHFVHLQQSSVRISFNDYLTENTYTALFPFSLTFLLN
jgi:hypothetical protein